MSVNTRPTRDIRTRRDAERRDLPCPRRRQERHQSGSYPRTRTLKRALYGVLARIIPAVRSAQASACADRIAHAKACALQVLVTTRNIPALCAACGDRP